MHILTLELPEDFADRLSTMHPNGLDPAVREAIKTYVNLGASTVTKLRADATAANVRIASIIKQALAKPEPFTSYHRKDRYRDIIADVLAGKRRATVAAKHNLSLIRVHQIMAKYKAEEALKNGTEYPRTHDVNPENRGANPIEKA